MMNIVLAAMAVTSCPRKEAAGVPGHWNTLLPRQVGDFIGIRPLDSAHAVLSDNTGLSGAQGRIHWHSNNPEEMFAAIRQDFTFDIGHIEQLGEFHIWNYNESGRTGNGLRNIVVSLSENNETYIEFGTFTLAQADGNDRLLATNLADGSFIDFAGKSARYIQISPADNYGGELYGLSALRLFRYKQDVFKGAYISASPIERFSPTGVWMPSPESYNLTNGAGLSDPFSADAVHSNNPNHMFAARSTIAGFAVDLRGKYPVEKIVIWNYNAPGNTDYGLKTIRISTSEDGITWRGATETMTLPQADGRDALEPSLVISGQWHTRYIRVDNVENHGGEFAGLSAVRAYIGEGWFADYAADWTALLSNYQGWGGADGIYMVNLDGKDYDPHRNPDDQATFIMFSDTLCGTVDPVTDRRTSVYMPNNTSAILYGGRPITTKIDFVYPQRNGPPALIIPDPLESASHGGGNKYYWMGDPFVIGDKLYIFALKIDTIDRAVFGFEQVGVDLVRYDIVDGTVDYESLVHINDTAHRLCDISDINNRWYLGGAVFENTVEAGVLNPDGYIYVYGYFDKTGEGRNMVVARVLAADIEDFGKYQYLQANNRWAHTMGNPKFLASDIAPEISVSQVREGPDAGKYYLVNTHLTIGGDLRLSVSPSLTGEFTDKRNIFFHDTTFKLQGTGNNSYNAKAHPAISNGRELFFSYNVNGPDCFVFADIYRPRMLRYAWVPDLSQEPR